MQPGLGSPARRERPFLLFGLISLALLVSSMQGSTVSVALPDMIDDLSAPLRWVSWVITVFTLSQAVSMPIAGKLSDELGRRRVFVGGLALFGIASVASGLAPNILVLIVARSIQGLAGGSLLPSAYGIVGDAFEGKRAQAIGMISSIFPIGSIIGPLAGGVIVEHWGWRWTFFMNVPLVAIVVVAGMLIMPASPRKKAGRIDGIGAGFFALTVLGMVYALTELSQRNVPARPSVVATSLLVAVAGLFLFLRRESRAREPLIDLQLMRRREFMFVNTLNFFYGAGIFGLFSFIPLYAQVGYGMSHTESGALLSPRAVAMIGASSLAAYLLPRTGYHKPIFVGLAGMTLSLIVLSRGFADVEVFGFAISNFWWLSIIVGFTGLAFGTSGPAANNAAIELAPHQIAAITGLRGMFRSLGGVLGTAFVVLIAARAETEAAGLERAFLMLAFVNLITMSLVFGIPDQVGALRTPEPVTPAPLSPPAPVPAGVATEVSPER